MLLKQMKNKKGGFTLIEILVVIGIVAILAAIVLIAINPARQFAQANDTQRRSNVNAILNAIGQYISDNKGTVPDSGDMSTTAKEIKSGSGGVDLCADLVPKYLPSLPVDPDNGSAVTEANCGSYSTGYSISKATSTDRITVSATSQVDGSTISVTR